MADDHRGRSPVRAGVPRELAAFLARAVEELPATRPRLITVPAPPAALERLWQAWPAAEALLWESPAGFSIAGVGRAVVAEARGADRFTALQAALEAATRAVERVAAPGLEAEDGYFVGGFAFTPGSVTDGAWGELGDARFVLPRWGYRRAGESARLTLALAAGEEARPQSTVAEYRHLWRTLGTAAPPSAKRAPRVVVREQPPAPAWEAAVERARARIAAGELAKVVLARRLIATARRQLRPETLLASLAVHEPGQYRFGFRTRSAALVGASPELLVRREGRRVTSEALAGSVVRGPAGNLGNDFSMRLVADAKQRQEHHLVVEAIAAALQEVCTQLEFPLQPEVRALRHLAHLATPFVGELRASLSVLELAARLHPTPAVGGVPAEVALQLIAELEKTPRGWFAGPVGVLFPSGDGELAVALRCALLHERSAQIFAGAGIVAASSPAAEVEETAAKAAAALAALGLVQ